MQRLVFVAIIREYRYLKTYKALLYCFVNYEGKMCNTSILLTHQCVVLHYNYSDVIIKHGSFY
jgi:hypothetical protein